MVIAALFVFAVLVAAWLLAPPDPGEPAAGAQPEAGPVSPGEPEPMPRVA